MESDKKYDLLISVLKEAGSAAIALSGGTDSIFLTYAASLAGSDRFIAVTVSTPYMFASEVEEAAAFCREHNIRHEELILEMPETIINNPPERCYLCKKAVMGAIKEYAGSKGLRYIFDGTNVDDAKDFRPGMKALEEYGIRSPLREAGLTKNDIRTLARREGLYVWNKPSNSCLLTRFPHGTVINTGELKKAERAEELLEKMGLHGVRLRVHGQMVRIECQPEQIDILLSEKTRKVIVDALKNEGYLYITADLEGYRTGSMNQQNE